MSPSKAERRAKIRGYANRQSVPQGGRIGFCLSNLNGEDLPQVPLRILRHGPRPAEVLRDTVEVPAQAVPARGWQGCGWKTAYTLEIGGDWVSGIYALRAGHKDDDCEDVHFIVRNARPGTDTPIVVQVPTTTINAYNNWGGASLYGYNSTPAPAPAVSFDRPQQKDALWPRGYGFADEWNLRVKAFVLWLDLAGYRADYMTSNDLHEDGALLAHYQLFVSIGHDEYWSQPMRQHFDAFLAAGGNAAIFSGNTGFWQIRMEGERGRLQVCYKNAEKDPVTEPARKTVTWRDAGYAENLSFGAGFAKGAWKGPGTIGHFVVHRPEHWAFAGTGLGNGDNLGNDSDEILLAYETNSVDYAIGVDGRPVPTGSDGTPENYLILASAELPDWGAPGNAAMGEFTPAGGGTVFNAATTDWACGLERCLATGNPLETATAKITRNVLNRLATQRRDDESGGSLTCGRTWLNL